MPIESWSFIKLALPLGGAWAWLGRKLRPPMVRFGDSTLRIRPRHPKEWFFHVPVSFETKWPGPRELIDCQVMVDLYANGETVSERGILLCWGDLQQQKPRDYERLRRGHVSLVPIAWRADLTSQPYLADGAFVNDGARSRPIGDRTRFKLKIRSDAFSAESKHFYLIRHTDDGHFSVEIEHDGLGVVQTSAPKPAHATPHLIIADRPPTPQDSGHSSRPTARTETSTRVAEENPLISYTFHGGTHHHNSIRISEPKAAIRFPRGVHAPDDKPAFVRFRTSTLELIDSHEVTSITDNGERDFTIHFDRALRFSTLACKAMPPTPDGFKAVIGADMSSIRIVFDGPLEPEIIALRFDE